MDELLAKADIQELNVYLYFMASILHLLNADGKRCLQNIELIRTVIAKSQLFSGEQITFWE
jgi:uncharacterized membrane protein